MRSQQERPVWHRTHANGWCATVQRDDDGRYAYGAHEIVSKFATLGHSSELGDAQRLADASIPEHACMPAECLQWEQGFACETSSLQSPEPHETRVDGSSDHAEE
jgi:hypothetical protein